MLARLFAGQGTGFYVDVGASHPSVGSVTKHFYDRAWSGINIEPPPNAHAMLLRDRPSDLNLCAAAVAAEGELRFVEAVDFLKVDVEVGEAAVLAGIDPRRHRPRALLIEAMPAGRPLQGRDAEPLRERSWEEQLLAAGYRFLFFDGLNAFYLRKEDAALAARLRLPPASGTRAADRRADELTRHLDALRGKLQQRNAEVARLTAERESLAAHLGGFVRRRFRRCLGALGLGALSLGRGRSDSD